jgi:hypothetical protein
MVGVVAAFAVGCTLSAPPQQQEEAAMVEVPGGGSVATPDGFAWSKPTGLLDPTDFLLSCAIARQTLAAMPRLAQRSRSQYEGSAKLFLPRGGGKLPDADWGER